MQGWITHRQLQHALEVQRSAGAGRIGKWLVEGCGLRQEYITRALAMQWQCPVLPTEGFDPEAMALAVPRLFVEVAGVVPLRTTRGRTLYLAFGDELDAATGSAIERVNGLRVESGLIDSTLWNAMRSRLLRCNFVDATLEQAPDIHSMSRSLVSALAAAQPRASRLVRLHHFFWLRMWLETGAMSTSGGGMPKTREDVTDRIYTVASKQ
jgi:hypothetical protein